MTKKWLPIGSVVILQGGNVALMIYGRKQRQLGTDTPWDYIACPYPEGNLDDEHTYLFNDEQIDKVLFVGFQTPEEFQLVDFLNKVEQSPKSE
jgi:hypothetical protein